jgi:hypothetical protein
VVSSLRTQVLAQPLTLTCNVHNQRDTPDRHGHHRGPSPPTADFAVIGVTIAITRPITGISVITVTIVTACTVPQEP